MSIFYTDPDHDDVTNQEDPASAAAKAAADAKPLEGEALQAAAIDAFDKGVSEADGKPPVEDNDEEEDVGPEGVDDNGKPIAPPAKKPKEGEAAKPKEEGEPDPDAAAKAEVEKEITERGLTGKSADRFRELAAGANEAKAFAPIREALKELGVETLEQVQGLQAAAESGVVLNTVMERSGATEDQFARVFGYLAAVNSRDPSMMRQAYDAMAQEQAWLAKELGLPAAGYDPLDVDPALKKRVADGDLDRKTAEELVAQRAAAKLAEDKKAKETQSTTAQQQREQAVQSGVQAVAAVGAELKSIAPSPEVFKAKLQIIQPGIALIQSRLPPSEWAGEIRALYMRTPDPVLAAAPRPAPNTQPLRPNGRGADGTFVKKPKDAMEAFDMGLQAAAGGSVDGI